MEDKNNSPDELEENMLAYVEKSHNLFRLGNELNNKIDNFKLEINTLQNEFKNELNSVKLSNQILTEQILQRRKLRSKKVPNSPIKEPNSTSSNLTCTDPEINYDPVSPRSPSIIKNKVNSEQNYQKLTEEEAFSKLIQMAKKDGFPVNEATKFSSEEDELDSTLQPEDQAQSSVATGIRECKVEINRLDVNDKDFLSQVSPYTLKYLKEKKALDEDKAIDRLCRIGSNKAHNWAKKSTSYKRKSLRPRRNVAKYSDSDSDNYDTASSDRTNDQNDEDSRDKIMETVASDCSEITEDESIGSPDLENPEKIKKDKKFRIESSDLSDSSKTSQIYESGSVNPNSINHEYRDSKQTPGNLKPHFDIPKLVLDEKESDEEKENKLPGNNESDEEIKLKSTRCSKRLTSETSDERETSRDDDEEEIEKSKNSTKLKGIIGGKLENEDPDQNKENILMQDNDSNSSDEIKPIIKKRKRLKCGSDSENSAKSKLRSRSKKDLDEKSEEESMSNDSDIQSVHSSEEESPTKQETRHKLRNIIQDGKLTKETQDAIQTERERKKRIEEKRALEASIAKDGKNELYLDVDPESKKMLVKVDPAISKNLKPHQVEGIKFIWDSCYESCEMIKNGHKGSGCLLAHCMGLGKTFQIIALVHTLLTNRDLTKCKRVLILLPVNVLTNWKKEFRKWTRPCQKQITVYLLPNEKGISRDLAQARFNEIESWYRRGGVLLLSYSMFVRIVSGKNIKPPKLVESFKRYLLSPGPNLVVCDEGHMLRVPTSALNKCVSLFSTARRIVLTGTPLQNNLIEYHCMVSFVKPNLLGTIKEFKNRFANPISNGQHRDSTEADVRYMKKRAHILHDVLEGCVQRKDYAVIRDFLKPKKEYVLSIRLSDIQVELYRTYIQMYGVRSKASKTKGAELFQDFQNLYRICSHPWVLKLNEARVVRREEKNSEKNFIAEDDEEEELVKEAEMALDDDEEIIEISTTRQKSDTKKPEVNGGGVNSEESTNKPVERWWTNLIPNDMEFQINMSGKLVVLEHILKLCAQRGDKLLIFSQSLFSLDLIEIFLEKLTAEKKDKWRKDEDYYRMDGQTDVNKRQHDVDKFNDERNRRSRLFLISTKAGGIGINLVGANRCIIFDACWNPSYDTQSIFRIYRFGQKKDVFIYRFLAQGTMEEKIYQRQVTKQSLSHRVIDEHQIDRHFTSQEINELYNFEPDLWDGKGIVHDIPDDGLLKSLLVDCKNWIVKYHEHDSLLENKLNEGLSEEERKAAWEEYENEKKMQNFHLSHSEPAFNTFQNIPNEQDFFQYYNEIFANESNRAPDYLTAQIQAIQREQLMEQIHQQSEIMRQHELRNSIQMDKILRIQSSKQLQNWQKMDQLFQNNQNNINIRIPSGQRSDFEYRPIASHQNLANILGIPRPGGLNENQPRESLHQIKTNLKSSSSKNPMNKNPTQTNQTTMQDQNKNKTPDNN